MDRDWQPAEVEVVAFNDQLLPGCAIDALDRLVVLAALAKGRREHARLDSPGGGPDTAIGRDISDDRHVEAFDSIEDDDRAAAGALELEDGRGDIELAPNWLVDAHQLIWKVALDHREKAAHALRVHKSPPDPRSSR